MSTFKPAELYQAFRSLEEVFGCFADIITGMKTTGFNYNTSMDLDVGTKDDLVALAEGKGPWPCERPPCRVSRTEFLMKVDDWTKKSRSAYDALEVLLNAAGTAGIEEIEFLTRRFQSTTETG